jgi:hypothetical protein
MSVVSKTDAALCSSCGMAMDSQYFDVAGFAALPGPGDEALLAEFRLPPQYCGILECFSQYTDRFFSNPSEVETRGLEWRLLVDGRPLSPYTNVQAILNPWGVGSYPVRIRLPESSHLAFSVRLRPGATLNIQTVGGRISGRYWFPE